MLQHIGFIVDGNRRWARERNLPTLEGHRRGFKKVEDVIQEVAKRNIPYASFYLFSTENWNRSEEEVTYLMKLIDERLSSLTKECQKLGLKCVILGRPEPVEPKLWQKLQDAEKSTENGEKGTIAICFNYGGQQEIVDGINRAIADGAENLTPETFTNYLYHPEVPPCDLIVRTSGEQRISGFMLWRAAYSEFLFLDKYFPDIDASSDFDDILEEYNKRNRRYGK